MRSMRATATLLSSLDVIAAETTAMLIAIEEVKHSPGRREAKRHVLEIRAKAQELFDWLSAVELEETRN